LALENLVDRSYVGQREELPKLSLCIEGDCDTKQHVEIDVCSGFETRDSWKRDAGGPRDVSLGAPGS
jgi:hypothetical protein